MLKISAKLLSLINVQVVIMLYSKSLQELSMSRIMKWHANKLCTFCCLDISDGSLLWILSKLRKLSWRKVEFISQNGKLTVSNTFLQTGVQRWAGLIPRTMLTQFCTSQVRNLEEESFCDPRYCFLELMRIELMSKFVWSNKVKHYLAGRFSFCDHALSFVRK